MNSSCPFCNIEGKRLWIDNDHDYDYDHVCGREY